MISVGVSNTLILYEKIKVAKNVVESKGGDPKMMTNRRALRIIKTMFSLVDWA